VNYANFVKKLQLPAGFAPPSRLTYEDVVATALSRANLSDDVRGINASVALIQKARGGGWPTEPTARHLGRRDGACLRRAVLPGALPLADLALSVRA
jgi:hypothetical protein